MLVLLGGGAGGGDVLQVLTYTTVLVTSTASNQKGSKVEPSVVQTGVCSDQVQHSTRMCLKASNPGSQTKWAMTQMMQRGDRLKLLATSFWKAFRLDLIKAPGANGTLI